MVVLVVVVVVVVGSRVLCTYMCRRRLQNEIIKSKQQVD